MRRALQLAERGPRTGGNPRVGCVLLDQQGATIAEGWHRGAGTPHAEIDALAQLAPGQASGATAVVSLEPCNHTGRTGPCSHALVDAGITRVVYALPDPGQASAHGAEHLAAHGVEIISGVLADEAEALNHEWLTAMRRQRPWVIAKLAMSLDGRGAAADGSSQWITSAAAREHAHVVRSQVDAILVGRGTVAADDPALTARRPDGSLFAHQPLPVVLGRGGDLPADSQLVRCHSTVRSFDIDVSAHTATEPLREQLTSMLTQLFDEDVRFVLVEGGPTTTTALLRAGLVDEVQAYLAPQLIGGPRTLIGDIDVTTLAQRLELDSLEVAQLGCDMFWRTRVKEA
ncbi:bifunctional diaminohydroxyphosphoribosylaminopyrimidine deaminase/5-amino-6-(5-phosphoribosylamino)uracil reductase RibD [Pseudoclavibacter soli]|uniref:bifunctional diaminohydroxyphosphoribosylaminopyrimidine deaminase/5-amino-6-(5-phosphoribosylamino)uracil reductase RibD n=1 Tax=Pseudoclavibacter soli TaxID=452623 RepID=UPI00040D1AE8|nr:bifunctional diaminohydroxyphosphoribosylaminopyrimidine deaminase/5-amino-6-(5-phosphoribosylamino)uracil reductase RibD [Pseudoclavibacter soli]